MQRVRGLLDQARAFIERGEPQPALRLCEQVLSIEPDSAEGHFLTGSIHAQWAAYEIALKHFQHAIELGADFPELYLNLGNIYRLTSDPRRAEQSYRRALEADPACALAHYGLGIVLKNSGALEEALPFLARAQAQAGLAGEVVRLRVTTLVELGRYEEAMTIAREAAARDSSCHETAVAYGYACQKLQRPQEALGSYERALALGAGDADVFNNLGIVLQDLGRLPEAFDSYDKALALKPGHTLARFHRALARLLAGEYGAGWPDYEARLLSREYARRPATYPRWDGSAPGPRTILVYGEQGLGDEIMFASCLPDLISVARHCVIECSPKLQGLFVRSFPRATVYAANAEARVPAEVQALGIDAELPIGSLPLHYRRSRDAFPRHGGYLRADPRRTAQWASWLAGLGPGLKVGLSWRGGTHKTRTPIRSIGLDRLLPLLRTPHVHFVSLQYTSEAPAEVEALRAGSGITITHVPAAVADYEETAGLVSALDLTLTVCTAVAHLAGALGRPVWVAAPYSPEWRYGCAGDDMPWYPSARLFRQTSYGSWDEVLTALTACLQDRVLAQPVRC